MMYFGPAPDIDFKTQKRARQLLQEAKAKAEKQPQKVKICPYCNAKMRQKEDRTYCNNCGYEAAYEID